MMEGNVKCERPSLTEASNKLSLTLSLFEETLDKFLHNEFVVGEPSFGCAPNPIDTVIDDLLNAEERIVRLHDLVKSALLIKIAH